MPLISKKSIVMRIIFLLLLTISVAACTTKPSKYLKRSANNKLFDTQGFQGGKRSPLYNKKYITRAKRNILNGEYDDEDYDDDSELQNSSSRNKSIYREMLEQEMDRKQYNRKNSKRRAYPSIVRANAKIDRDNTQSANLELREELEQIKSMLKDTKKEMSSYKCPTAQELEKKTPKKTNKTQDKVKQTNSSNIPKPQNNKKPDVVKTPIKTESTAIEQKKDKVNNTNEDKTSTTPINQNIPPANTQNTQEEKDESRSTNVDTKNEDASRRTQSDSLV